MKLGKRSSIVVLVCCSSIKIYCADYRALQNEQPEAVITEQGVLRQIQAGEHVLRYNIDNDERRALGEDRRCMLKAAACGCCIGGYTLVGIVAYVAWSVAHAQP